MRGRPPGLRGSSRTRSPRNGISHIRTRTGPRGRRPQDWSPVPHEQRRLLKMGKLCRLMRSAGPADRTVMQRPRAEIRMLCADMVEVCWKEPAGRKCKSTALLEDISPSGMCLQFEIPVSIGTHVDVHCPGDRLAGVVRYCVYREIGYFVGIELEPSSRWSRQQFEPQHLLDLEELVLRSARRAGETIH